MLIRSALGRQVRHAVQLAHGVDHLVQEDLVRLVADAARLRAAGDGRPIVGGEAEEDED